MNAKSEVTKTIQYEKQYPDPRTLPAQPSRQQPRPQLTLSDLIPGEYVSATARVVHLKTSERKDALGSKMVFSGVLEDSTFKIPFVSHRITYPLLRNSEICMEMRQKREIETGGCTHFLLLAVV